MKKIFLALTLIVGTVFLTGCKGDSLETPAYKSSSALYQVTNIVETQVLDGAGSTQFFPRVDLLRNIILATSGG